MDVVEEEPSGGFTATFVDEVADYLKCKICMMVLKDPLMIVDCGHKFCTSCFNTMKSHTRNPSVRCPVDRGIVNNKKVGRNFVIPCCLSPHSIQQSSASSLWDGGYAGRPECNAMQLRYPSQPSQRGHHVCIKEINFLWLSDSILPSLQTQNLTKIWMGYNGVHSLYRWLMFRCFRTRRSNVLYWTFRWNVIINLPVVRGWENSGNWQAILKRIVFLRNANATR